MKVPALATAATTINFVGAGVTASAAQVLLKQLQLTAAVVVSVELNTKNLKLIT